MVHKNTPTENEVFFDKDDIIVSKTDTKGRITYANHTFQDVAGYTEQELLGQPHSLIRHPDMPRSVFKLLWDVINNGGEIFAYVKNMAKSGDYYWVFAHVTPTRDQSGQIIGFHSNRRIPRREAVNTIIPIYAELLRTEQQHRNGKEALSAGTKHLLDFVKASNKSYDELILSL